MNAIKNTRLNFSAEQVSSDRKMNDLVLNPKTQEAITKLKEQINSYEKTVKNNLVPHAKPSGLHALFTGPSGTGKTMAAEVLANELSLDLFRIDLSQVVSKYIGETEKNLQKVFSAAESAGAILFFDEADALFGRRTEVRDSHDKYANMEVSYLLQQIENFRGILILAFNSQLNLELPFFRRFNPIVEFEKPGPHERLKLWKKYLPRQAQQQLKNEISVIARKYDLTGGSIVNLIRTVVDGNQVPLSGEALVRAIQKENREPNAVEE